VAFFCGHPVHVLSCVLRPINECTCLSSWDWQGWRADSGSRRSVVLALPPPPANNFKLVTLLSSQLRCGLAANDLLLSTSDPAPFLHRRAGSVEPVELFRMPIPWPALTDIMQACVVVRSWNRPNHKDSMPWLSRQTGPVSSGTTNNSGDPCTNILSTASHYS